MTPTDKYWSAAICAVLAAWFGCGLVLLLNKLKQQADKRVEGIKEELRGDGKVQGRVCRLDEAGGRRRVSLDDNISVGYLLTDDSPPVRPFDYVALTEASENPLQWRVMKIICL